MTKTTPRTETRVMSEGGLKRLTSGPGQFVLAIGACLLLVLAVFLITPREQKGELLPRINYEYDARALARNAPYPAYVPVGLPDGWRATSTRLTGTNTAAKDKVAWHLGFLTPEDAYAGLEQSNEEPSGPQGFVRRMTNVFQSDPTQAVGRQQINGHEWLQYVAKSKGPQNSLVWRAPKSTVIVTGTASFAELTRLAAALREQPAG